MLRYVMLEYFDPIVFLLGWILILAGGIQFMIEHDLGVPPGGCALIGLLIAGFIKTKIGRVGLILVIIETITSIQLTEVIYRLLI